MTIDSTQFSATEADVHDAWRYVDAEMSDGEREAFEVRLLAEPQLVELVVELSRIALAAPLAAVSAFPAAKPVLKPATTESSAHAPVPRQRAGVVALALATCVCLLIVFSIATNPVPKTAGDGETIAADAATETANELGQLVSLYSGDLFHPVESNGYWEAEADIEPVELEVPDWLFAALELDSVPVDPSDPSMPNETDDEIDELGIF